MKKILLSIFIMCFLLSPLFSQNISTPLVSPNNESTPNVGKTKSYALIGANYEIFYFIAPQKSTEDYLLTTKMPLNNYFGAELGLGAFNKPITTYSIGSTNYTGMGREEFTHITLNILYYFWFLKELQLKIGFDYYKFTGGWIQVNPTAITSGYIIEMYKNWSENLLGINMGGNLDINIYNEFYVSTTLLYRYVFLTDNITKNGFISFSIGLSYKL